MDSRPDYGGVIDTSRLLSAQATGVPNLTFIVLAGIVVGGTSIAGGEGSVPRTTIGVLFIAMIYNGINLTNIDQAVPADRARRDHFGRRLTGRLGAQASTLEYR